MKISITKPAETIEVEARIVLYTSDGRNPLDGYKPAKEIKNGDAHTLAPEVMGTPQPWAEVCLGDKRFACPAKQVKCKDGEEFFAAAITWAQAQL